MSAAQSAGGVGAIVSAMQAIDAARDGLLGLMVPRYYKFIRPLRARILLSVLEREYAGSAARMSFHHRRLVEFGSHTTTDRMFRGLSDEGLVLLQPDTDRRATVVLPSPRLIDRCEAHAGAMALHLDALASALPAGSAAA